MNVLLRQLGRRFIWVLAFVVVCAPSLPAHAAGENPVPNLDLIVLVDQSNSQLVTDPYQTVTEDGKDQIVTNRLLALNTLLNTLYADTLDNRYRIAIILYGTGAVRIQDFVTLDSLDQG